MMFEEKITYARKPKKITYNDLAKLLVHPEILLANRKRMKYYLLLR